jgi:AcrR family transcriptional regulator
MIVRVAALARSPRTTPADERGAAVNESIDALLDAAESCFDRYGIEKTTMLHVVAAAGMSRAYAYRLVGSRDELIRQVLVRRARRFNVRAAAFLASKRRLDEALVEGILLAVKLADRDPYFGILVTAATMDPQHRIPGSAEDALELTDELWRPVLEAGRARGELQDGVLVDDLVLWIMHIELTLLASRRTFGTDDRAQERQLRSLLVTAVCQPTKTRRR